MEPLSLATVIVDECGTVLAADGTAEGFVLPAGAVGRPWNSLTEAAGPLPEIPLVAEAYPWRARFTSNGQPLTADGLVMPGAKPVQFMILIHSDDSTDLPMRLQQLCNVGEVSCGISHEMNNALTILCGWLEVLRMDAHKYESLTPTIDLLRDEAGRLASLARNLQEVARGDTAHEEDMNVEKLLQDVTTLVRHEMDRSRITLETHVAQGIPSIRGSSARLKQALLNLLVNARQAMPSGGSITLAAEAVNGHVAVSVQDTGCGIPIEHHRSVFRKFFTTKNNGTGLGLTITRKIVEDHGGHLDLHSEPGLGSKFTLRLPAKGGV